MELKALVADYEAKRDLKQELDQKLDELRAASRTNKDQIDALQADWRATRAQFSGLAEKAERALEALREKSRAALRDCDPELAARIDAVERDLRASRDDAGKKLDALSTQIYDRDTVALDLNTQIDAYQRALAEAEAAMNDAVARYAAALSQPSTGTARSASFCTPPLHLLPR